ncbi:MAG: hypothetical protein JW937_06955 [Candidatus Omnitrophica bacterium]|nr:hypothetical protein [Candidatus Omnitrophota bacterium]
MLKQGKTADAVEAYHRALRTLNRIALRHVGWESMDLVDLEIQEVNTELNNIRKEIGAVPRPASMASVTSAPTYADPPSSLPNRPLAGGDSTSVLRNRVSAVEEAAVAAQGRLGEANQIIERLKEDNRALFDELSTARVQLREVQEKSVDLHQRALDAERSNVEMERELAEWQRRSRQLEMRNAQVQENLALLEKDRIEAVREVSGMRDQVDSLQARYHDAMQALEAAEAASTEAQRRADNLSRQVLALQEDNKHQVLEVTADFEQRRMAVQTRLESEIKSLKDKLDTAELTSSQVQSQLAKERQESGRLIAEYQDLLKSRENELQRKSQSSVNAREEVTVLREELAQVRKQLSEAERDLLTARSFQKDLEESRDELAKLKAQLRDSESQMASNQKALSDAMERVKTAGEMQARAENVLGSLKDQAEKEKLDLLDSFVREKSQLLRQLAEATQRVEEMRKEATLYRSHMLQAQERLDELRTTLVPFSVSTALGQSSEKSEVK